MRAVRRSATRGANDQPPCRTLPYHRRESFSKRRVLDELHVTVSRNHISKRGVFGDSDDFKVPNFPAEIYEQSVSRVFHLSLSLVNPP
jgi:hypothetical protein